MELKDLINTKAVTLREAIDEVDREIQVRQRCFVRWVAEGRVSQTDARDRLSRLMVAGAWLAGLAKCPDELRDSIELPVFAQAGSVPGAPF